MKRIGLAASKISKGNILSYNLTVCGLTVLFGLFVFVVSSCVVAFALLIVSLVLQHFLPSANSHSWLKAFRTCLICSGILIGIGALVAILTNIKFKSKV